MSVRTKMAIAPLAHNPHLLCDERNCMRAAAFGLRAKLVDSAAKRWPVRKHFCSLCIAVQVRNLASLFVEEAILAGRTPSAVAS